VRGTKYRIEEVRESMTYEVSEIRGTRYKAGSECGEGNEEIQVSSERRGTRYEGKNAAEMDAQV